MPQGIPETPDLPQFTLGDMGLDDEGLTMQDLISIRRGDQNVLENMERAAQEGRTLGAYTGRALELLKARIAEITKRVPLQPQG